MVEFKCESSRLGKLASFRLINVKGEVAFNGNELALLRSFYERDQRDLMLEKVHLK